MYAKRLLYLGYYFKELDWAKLAKFQRYTLLQAQKSILTQWLSAIYAVFRYNISIEEFYNFRFFEASGQEKDSFAGTGYMYEYQLAMNPPQYRSVLEDKIQFLQRYKEYVHHDFLTLEELRHFPEKAKPILRQDSGKIVLKSSDVQ